MSRSIVSAATSLEVFDWKNRPLVLSDLSKPFQKAWLEFFALMLDERRFEIARMVGFLQTEPPFPLNQLVVARAHSEGGKIVAVGHVHGFTREGIEIRLLTDQDSRRIEIIRQTIEVLLIDAATPARSYTWRGLVNIFFATHEQEMVGNSPLEWGYEYQGRGHWTRPYGPT